jgi:hypothetical protein
MTKTDSYCLGALTMLVLVCVWAFVLEAKPAEAHSRRDAGPLPPGKIVITTKETKLNDRWSSPEYRTERGSRGMIYIRHLPTGHVECYIGAKFIVYLDKEED